MLKTLGFRHPLDDETSVMSLEPLKELSFVKQWDRNAYCFLSKKPVPGKVLDERGLQEVTRAVLRSVGISLEMDFKRPRGPDKTRIKVRRYRLSKESCEAMGELMVLKEVVATEFVGANEWLSAHPLKRWRHLQAGMGG